MKKLIILVITVTLAIVTTITIQIKNRYEVKESMTYFPLNESISFSSANTSLTHLSKTAKDEYSLVWSVRSALKEKAYLRQDISLLFLNGRLKDLLGDWQQNVNEITLQKKVILNNTAKLEAISYHNAEIHEKNKPITSAQYMSSAQLFVIDNDHQPLHSFTKANTIRDEQLEKQLNETIAKLKNDILQKAVAKHSLNLNDYKLIALTDLVRYNDEQLFSFTKEETNAIIGRIWEGIYKNYYLNVKKADNTIVSPLGSTVPLLLFSKNNDKLLIIFEMNDGELITLIQALD